MLKSPIMATDATTNAPAPTQSRNDKRATGFMLLAVAGYSVMPLAVVLFGAREFPFLFGGLWRGGIAIAYAVFLVLFFHKSCSTGKYGRPSETGCSTAEFSPIGEFSWQLSPTST